MKRAFPLALILATSAIFAADATEKDVPFAAWPYRLALQLSNPDLADESGLARVTVNLGTHARPDGGDVRILDDKGREQPWKLARRDEAGDLTILFQTVKGIHDYELIFGNAKATMPDYPADLWPRAHASLDDPVIIDDMLPRNAHTHGLWQWVREPALSGSFSHTSPITDRTSIHGTSNLSNQKVRHAFRVPLRTRDHIIQYVMLDPEDPPTLIGLRLAFEQRFAANVWDAKTYVNLTWGKGNLDLQPSTSGRSRRNSRRGRYRSASGRTVSRGELPAVGRWVRLDISVEELLRIAPEIRWRDGGLPDLFGIEFVTDGGRAWWDVTSIDRVPSAVEVVDFRRATGLEPVIVTCPLDRFTLANDGPAYTLVRCHVAAPDDLSRRWRTPDGSATDERAPLLLLESVPDATLTVELGAGESRRTVVENLPVVKDTKKLPRLDLDIDLMSCPFIVREDARGLFSLRLEGTPRRAMDAELVAVELDSADREISRTSAEVAVWPGDKHPTFRAFSLDFGAPGLSRVRFELRLRGRKIAERFVNVYDSKSDLSTLTLKGDRFVDRLGTPVVVRAEVPGPERDPKRPAEIPSRCVLIGEVPAPAFGEQLRKALVDASDHPEDTRLAVVAPQAFPAWSLPARMMLAVNAKTLPENTDAVVIAAAGQMMLADIPAPDAVETLGVMIDQVRRVRPDAAVVLLIPSVHDGFEEVSRQYALALKVLGIRKRVLTVDLYSRVSLLAEDDPDLFYTSRIDDGIATRRLPPVVVDELIDGIVRRFR